MQQTFGSDFKFLPSGSAVICCDLQGTSCPRFGCSLAFHRSPIVHLSLQCPALEQEIIGCWFKWLLVFFLFSFLLWDLEGWKIAQRKTSFSRYDSAGLYQRVLQRRETLNSITVCVSKVLNTLKRVVIIMAPFLQSEDFLHSKSKKMLISLAAELLVIARSGYSSCSQIAKEFLAQKLKLLIVGMRCLSLSSELQSLLRVQQAGILPSDSSPDRSTGGFARWLHFLCHFVGIILSFCGLFL